MDIKWYRFDQILDQRYASDQVIIIIIFFFFYGGNPILMNVIAGLTGLPGFT
jgi:hypothetical protein